MPIFTILWIVSKIMSNISLFMNTYISGHNYSITTVSETYDHAAKYPKTSSPKFEAGL